tara:strand:+ start:801 stop:1268 length:468 start_codon:yes stop_codon:yes gene_type:complete
MKKLLLLLLFPLISFSQVTYKDLLSINSLDQFKRVMIENDYDFVEKTETETLTYAISPTKNDEGELVSSDFANFHIDSTIFSFSWHESHFGKFRYKVIYDEVKEKCKFSKILETEDLDNDGKPIDYACYTCPKSSVGLIGFTKAYGLGVIFNVRE